MIQLFGFLYWVRRRKAVRMWSGEQQSVSLRQGDGPLLAHVALHHALPWAEHSRWVCRLGPVCGPSVVGASADSCLLFHSADKTIKEYDFAEILKKSICLEQSTQAWCENCEKYQPTVSPGCPSGLSAARKYDTVPHRDCVFFLSVGANAQHPLSAGRPGH